jgi:septal ring factor EnvC (AmiA/AmiB activator)
MEHAKEEENARKAEEAARKVEQTLLTPAEDLRISGSFENNRGRLPIPVTGPYRIVSHFGQYNVEGLKNVVLDNKGINIQGSAGSQARCIYDGEVSAVYQYAGIWVVIVRHGAYFSVYCNLRSINVTKGQKLSPRQAIGVVGPDNILQFQLRKGTAKLNPEAWLGR